MHLAEAFRIGSRTMYSTELSEKAFDFALGIQCRSSLEAFKFWLRELITSRSAG